MIRTIFSCRCAGRNNNAHNIITFSIFWIFIALGLWWLQYTQQTQKAIVQFKHNSHVCDSLSLKSECLCDYCNYSQIDSQLESSCKYLHTHNQSCLTVLKLLIFLLLMSMYVNEVLLKFIFIAFINWFTYLVTDEMEKSWIGQTIFHN